MYGYIYLIVNNVNGKTYVGKRKLYNKKWNEDGYMGSGKHLKSAQKKYGIENFEKFLITYTSSEANKGKHWYTNGIDSVYISECPIGYKPGRVL